ncbi:hypothetical protein GJ496_001253 [Pomphorhynchus laevis]|nr:hypothetical protein GJ496_001253 [Pomphorhynchus laevis]
MSNMESRIYIADLLVPKLEADSPPVDFRSDITSPAHGDGNSGKTYAVTANVVGEVTLNIKETESQAAYVPARSTEATANRLREQQTAPRLTERGPVSLPLTTMRNTYLLNPRNARVGSSPNANSNVNKAVPDSIEFINKKERLTKWGSDSFYMSGVFNYDYQVTPDFKSNWCRAFIQASGQMPIILRQVAAEPGNLCWNTHIRTYTEQGSGNVLSLTQMVCHSAKALTDENRFTIHYDSPQFLQSSTTATIREFKINADSVDLKAASNLISAKLSLDKVGSLALAECVSYGLYIADTTAWYAKLWLMFFHLSWMEEQGLVVQPVAPAVDSCVAVSFAGAPADVTNAVNTVADFCTTEKLVVFEQDFDISLLRVFWAAANGLPRFATPAADPPRVCLLDGLVVPCDPVCFVRTGLPILPGVGPMTAQQVLRAIAVLTGIRDEHRFTLSGYYRACLYYNRWRPMDTRGKAQYYASTMEWRVATWHIPRFTNSLLVYLNRINLPHHIWAETELRKLFVFGGDVITDSSVWIAAAVCISYSTAMSVFNIKGSDLVGIYRDVDQNGAIMPPISTTAAIIRKQMGLPSLGGDAFCVSDWESGWRYTEDILQEGTAWDVVWSRSIPYVIDPTTVLWMCSDYSVLWHIPRAPVTYRIMKEFHKLGRGGEARFIPALGDEIIANYDVDSAFNPAAPYVPMLMGILAQSTRLEMPAPTFWITWSPQNMLMTQLSADDDSIPDFIFSPDTMTVRAGTGVLYDWHANVYTSPVWNRRDMSDAWWERISSIGIERRPAIGIEPIDRIHNHQSEPIASLFPVARWNMSSNMDRDNNEESREEIKQAKK